MLEASSWPSGDDPERVREVRVTRFAHGEWSETADEVAAEEPFEVRVGGRSVALIMRTPGHDVFLAVGFLTGEGVIARREDVLSVKPALDRDGFPQPNVLDARLRPELEASERLWQRNFVVSSSCGLCGKASIEAARFEVPPIPPGKAVSVEVLLGLDTKLRDAQAVFARTGGLHAAGLFDLDGNLLVHHEDVGRHNAVDKVVGQLLLDNQLPARDSVLMLSGRASFELLQKAANAGIGIAAAVGAPSSLAVEMAATCNVTLIGYLRSGRFVVYSGFERVAKSRCQPCDGITKRR